MVEDASPDAVVLERSFDEPVGVVWQMWTDPEHFKAWYGPVGATVPVAEMDVRVGGNRLVCMEVQSPDGPIQMWFVGHYRSVVENQRLVYTESMADKDGNVLDPSAVGMPDEYPTTTEITVEFFDADGGTRMVLTHAGISSDSPGATGWTMAFDKLAAYIAARRGQGQAG
jgi:uncharacterized protein YndB with AHSA1/START domain